MARHGSQDRTRDDESASELSITAINGIYSQGYSGFSFHTEPLGDHHSGSSWIQTTEGQQNFHVPATQSGAQNGTTDSYDSIPMPRLSQGTAISAIDAHLFPLDVSDSWNTQHSSVDALMLERWISQNSHEAVGSPPMSVRTITSDHPDQAQSVELRPSLSQVSFPISSGHSDVTDRSFSLPDSALYPSSPHYTDGQVYSESTFLEEMDSSVRRGSFHNGPSNGSARRSNQLIPGVTGSSYAPYTTSAEEVMFTSPMDVMSQTMFESSISQDGLSPTMDSLNNDDQLWEWDASNGQPGSGISSPFPNDLAWPVATATNSPMNYTTSPTGPPQRSNRKSMVPRNGRVSLEASATYQRVPEVAGLYDGLTAADRSLGHGSIDIDTTPREHPLYQNATTRSDGLYHCPWEGQDPSCNHKPEKLKCNYDKFVDSHLKPYRCKIVACENARFSSTACLLRHEREAHAMHGHGEKPFLCTFDGCERGVVGNGFPRHWNLCDHMKRVHNRSPSPSTGTAKPPRGSKKRKHEASETGSSKRSPVTTSPSVEKPSAPVRSLSLNEQFYHHHQELLSKLQDMPDPENLAATLENLRNASHSLQEMAKATAAKLKVIPKMERSPSQQSG